MQQAHKNDVSLDEGSWEDAIGSGDLELKLGDGTTVLAHSQFLLMASPIIRDALQCHRPGPGRQDQPSSKRQRVTELGETEGQVDSAGHAAPASPSSSLTSLPVRCMAITSAPAFYGVGSMAHEVEGDLEAWTRLLEFLYHPALTGKHRELSPSSAFRILPIAHAYNMKGILRSCVEVARQSKLPLRRMGSEPPPPPQASQEPDVFEWLAMGDAKQFSPLVRACLEQLSQGEALPVVRSVISCRQSRSHLGQLCSETLMELLNVVTGLPPEFKGVRVPDLTRDQPSFHKEGVDGVKYCEIRRVNFFHGHTLLLPRAEHVIEVLNIEVGTSSLLEGSPDPSIPSKINTFAASACNDQLALSGDDAGIVKLWDLATGKCRHSFQGEVEGVAAVCFCGQHQAAFDSLISITVMDLATGAAALPELEGHDGCVSSLQASPDGRLLLSASDDCSLRLWDLRQRSCVRTMTGHSSVSTASMDGRGRLAVSASGDKTLKTWDLGSGRCLATMQGHETCVHGVAMDEAGSTALSYGADYVRVWDLSRSLLTATHTWPGQQLLGVYTSHCLSQVAVLSIAAVGDRCGVKIWSAP